MKGRPVVLQLPSDLLVTLEQFCREQGGTIALRTLEEQAKNGLLPGAQKIGSRWWINRLAQIQDQVATMAGGEDGIAAQGRALPGQLDQSSEPGAGVFLRKDKRRGRKPKARPDRTEPHPIQGWRLGA